MVYRTSKVINDPRLSLSFDIFSKTLQGNQADIRAMLDVVLYARDLFNRGETIWPEQCDHIISAFDMIQEPVNDMLDTVARIPLTINSLRYPLIRALDEVSRYISDLVLLVTLFRANYQDLNHGSSQRWEIRRKFELLVQSCEDIVQEVSALFDKARFQERLLEI